MQVVEHLYPSRLADRPRLIERRDPVVYGEPALQGPLAVAQLGSYAEHGFFVMPSRFSLEETRARLP